MQVLGSVKVPQHGVESYYIILAQVVILLADQYEGTCDIGLSGCHCIYTASNHRLAYGLIAGMFVRLFHCHLFGNWHGLIHCELRNDCLNGAVLIDIYCVMLPIVFNVHTKTEGDAPEIMHVEHLLNLMHDLPNQDHFSNNQAIINIQNNCRDDGTLILNHKESSIDMGCNVSNRDHKVCKSAVPNFEGRLQALERLSQVE